MPLSMRIVFVLLGLGAVAVSLWLRQMHLRAQAWHRVTARIVRSERVADAQDADSSVVITYQFKVGEREFTSSRISFSLMPNGAKSQQRLVARFAPGSVVDAYYDPSDPRRCVLIREATVPWLWGPAVGVVFIALAVLAP